MMNSCILFSPVVHFSVVYNAEKEKGLQENKRRSLEKENRLKMT